MLPHHPTPCFWVHACPGPLLKSLYPVSLDTAWVLFEDDLQAITLVLNNRITRQGSGSIEYPRKCLSVLQRSWAQQKVFGMSRLTPVSNSLAALPSRELSSESKEVWDVQLADEILISPVLLNSQETTRFCLAKGPRTRYSQTIHVNTVGECRMPFVLINKLPCRPFHIHMHPDCILHVLYSRIACGLKDVFVTPYGSQAGYTVAGSNSSLLLFWLVCLTRRACRISNAW